MLTFPQISSLVQAALTWVQPLSIVELCGDWRLFIARAVWDHIIGKQNDPPTPLTIVRTEIPGIKRSFRESTQLLGTSKTPLVLQRTTSLRRECEIQLFSNEEIESKHLIPRKTISHDFSSWFQFTCACRNSLRAGTWINKPIHTWVAIRCHSLQETTFNGVGCPVSDEQLDICTIQSYSSVQCMSVLNHCVVPIF